MTAIRIQLIPDGGAQVPAEARDGSIMASYLEEADPPSASPAPSWRDIKRVTRGDGSVVFLEIDNASLDDYAPKALEAFSAAIAQINGLKEHPNGWVEVDEKDER